MDFMKSRIWGKVMLSVSNDMDLPDEEKIFSLTMIGEQFLNCFREERTAAEREANSNDIKEACKRG